MGIPREVPAPNGVFWEFLGIPIHGGILGYTLCAAKTPFIVALKLEENGR